MTGYIPQSYDDATFDPVRTAAEAGFENVPLYFAEAEAGAGSTDRPSINLTSSGNVVRQGIPWAVVAVLVVILLWLKK